MEKMQVNGLVKQKDNGNKEQGKAEKWSGKKDKKEKPVRF